MKKFFTLILLVAVAFSVSVSEVKAADHTPPFVTESKIKMKNEKEVSLFSAETLVSQVYVAVRAADLFKLDVRVSHPDENKFIYTGVNTDRQNEELNYDNYFYPTNHERIRAGLNNLYTENKPPERKSDPLEEIVNETGIHPDPGLLSA